MKIYENIKSDFDFRKSYSDFLHHNFIIHMSSDSREIFPLLRPQTNSRFLNSTQDKMLHFR